MQSFNKFMTKYEQYVNEIIRILIKINRIEMIICRIQTCKFILRKEAIKCAFVAVTLIHIQEQRLFGTAN